MPARRTGVIHAWDGDAPADFAIDHPVPVYVRDPLTRAVIGRGTVASGRVEGGDLWADIDWPEDVEARAGATTPAARCKFDESGRLVRVVVELDETTAEADESDDDDFNPSPGEHAAPSTHEDFSNLSADRRAATAGDPPQPNRRQAEMAANDRTNVNVSINPDDERDQAEMAGRDDGGHHEKTPAEIAAENARLAKQLAETNRKAKADRLRLEEFEKQQREAEEAKLGEGDRIKRERDTLNAERQKAIAERQAAVADLARFQLDLEIERMALATGFKYPVMVPKLIDRDLIDFDEDNGKPTNLKDVLKRLADTYPDLLSPAPGRPGTPPRTGPVARNGAPDPRRDEPMSIIDDLRRKVNYPGR